MPGWLMLEGRQSQLGAMTALRLAEIIVLLPFVLMGLRIRITQIGIEGDAGLHPGRIGLGQGRVGGKAMNFWLDLFDPPPLDGEEEAERLARCELNRPRG